ncbi:Exonuclease RNase T/DNA polymerase III [Penicillium brevicompactum]|uniref:Exonuclease RNase T/DNA polymerase III n=1 Tax=Penicillium brevicompactum TaxID=5074 RepID=UPI00253F97D4|nr:Exonuclease RNase T/DNA polymerase III [Penicillium brevicompactum]KAJ5325822.1 Exonuclease RNase T/DNA polymerase III [Penicillium brevicompactum]
MASTKPADEKSFACPGCQKGNFKSLHAVKVHFEAKGHPLKCAPCDSSFDSLKTLLGHCARHGKPADTAPKRVQKQEQGSVPSMAQSSTPVDSVPSRKSKKGQQLQNQENIPTSSAPMNPPKQEQDLGQPRPQSSKPVDPMPSQKSKKLQQPKKQDNQNNPVDISEKQAYKFAQKFLKGQDLSTVKPVDPTPGGPANSKPTPSPRKAEKAKEKAKAKAEKTKERPKAKKPVEILARPRPQSPLRSVFSGEPKPRGNPSFGFGDTLLDTSERERETARNAVQASQNENHHVTLELLEQNLIFRYLLARCHSDTRLAKHGFTFQPGLNESHKRPSKQCPIKRGLFREVPRFSSDNVPKRRAIVLDCEMVQVEEGRRELAFLSAIDFLTGEVLIDNYVQPNSRVVNWDSRFSGVTPSAMNKAVKKGTALRGWEGARSKLWSFMNSDTILVGHSLNNDLDVLGMIHWNIVDSSIMTSEAVFLNLHSGEQLTRTWGLKTLTTELVNYDIQVGKQGHSALEDAQATRDVVIWCIRYPELLKVWADNAREEENMRVAERDMKRITEREQLEDQRRLEMESRVHALSQGLTDMAVAAPADESDEEPYHMVNTGYVSVQSVEYF